jgi:co-chaperonin GroES (HSP10)
VNYRPTVFDTNGRSFRPLHDGILVRPDPRPERRIVLPNSRKSADTATVVAMGPGLALPSNEFQRWPMPPIQVGDRVLVTEHLLDEGHTQLLINGVRHVLIKDNDILAGVDEVVAL